MSNYISAKKVIETILLNNDTLTILDEYIVSYLKLNPQLLTKCIENQGLYHVYIRNKDERCTNILYNSILQLIKSFATEVEAIDWIKQYGKSVIDLYDFEDDYHVLVIIFDSNKGIYEDDYPSQLYCISEKKYKTFVFKPQAMLMMASEAKYFDCHSEREFHSKVEPSIEELTWVTKMY
jgi:hypothetical protein